MCMFAEYFYINFPIMNEKRSFTLICLLILYVGLAKAQYCNVQRGAKLYYKTIDIKSKTTTIDISHIAEVYEKGDDLIVKQLNYGKKWIIPSKIVFKFSFLFMIKNRKPKWCL